MMKPLKDEEEQMEFHENKANAPFIGFVQLGRR